MAEHNDPNPLAHVVDHPTLDLPYFGEVELKNILGFQITRFMVMEVVAALLIIAIVVPLARHVARNRVTRGRFLNIFEALIMFIRDGVARPAIDGGEHGHDDHGHGPDVHHTNADHHEKFKFEGGSEGSILGVGPGGTHGLQAGRASDAFLPFLWTMFFFILFNNLLGMFPGGASATGNINVTGVLAAATLITVLIAGFRSMGFAGFWVGIVPKMDVPQLLKGPLFGMMFVIEVLGLIIKHFVLSVRLFANMLAGHIVLAVILGFIAQVGGVASLLVTPASILGSVAISLLELFVAFLQAYVFTFLAALFIGSASHPH